MIEIPPYLQKLFSVTYISTLDKPWYWTLYNYYVDSQFRTQKRLDLFLKEQIANPDPDVLKLANELRKGIKNSDELIIKILKWVRENITYKSDSANFGKVEYWATAKETLTMKADDCDGINGLIHVLFRLASAEVMDNYFFSCIGDVRMPDGSNTGHYWNIYFSGKTGKWYTIDGTYYPNLTEIKKGRAEYKIGDKYLNVWYYFNSTYSLKQA
jgi:transglutaminase-like putative cysteine protease